MTNIYTLLREDSVDSLDLTPKESAYQKAKEGLQRTHLFLVEVPNSIETVSLYTDLCDWKYPVLGKPFYQDGNCKVVGIALTPVLDKLLKETAQIALRVNDEERDFEKEKKYEINCLNPDTHCFKWMSQGIFSTLPKTYFRSLATVLVRVPQHDNCQVQFGDYQLQRLTYQLYLLVTPIRHRIEGKVQLRMNHDIEWAIGPDWQFEKGQIRDITIVSYDHIEKFGMVETDEVINFEQSELPHPFLSDDDLTSSGQSVELS